MRSTDGDEGVRVRQAEGTVADEAMPRGRENLGRRELIKRESGELFAQVAECLRRIDPMGIIFDGQNPDEYEPEVGTILPRLSEARGPTDVARIIHEEFVKWFTHSDVGPAQRYEAAGVEVWEIWRRYQDQTSA